LNPVEKRQEIGNTIYQYIQSIYGDAAGKITGMLLDNDRIVDYELRLDDQKRRAVEALMALNYRVIAAGDSYNDTAMLGAAEHGFLFHAPENVKQQFPHFPALDTYDDLLARIRAVL